MPIKMKDASKELVFKGGGRIASSAYVHPSATLTVPIDIADNVTIYGGCEIGQFTYLNVGCVVYSNTSIGKYCSIGRFVEMGLAQHPISYLSTHPFQCANSLFTRFPGYSEIHRKPWRFHPPTTIGNDVWIGAKVNILSGVNIGNGSIIAAGSVVTKDIPPYSIVGGIPAKVIKMRFSDEIIEKLEAIRWWDMSLDTLKDLPFESIEECIEILEKRSKVFDKIEKS